MDRSKFQEKRTQTCISPSSKCLARERFGTRKQVISQCRRARPVCGSESAGHFALSSTQTFTSSSFVSHTEALWSHIPRWSSKWEENINVRAPYNSSGEEPSHRPQQVPCQSLLLGPFLKESSLQGNPPLMPGPSLLGPCHVLSA